MKPVNIKFTQNNEKGHKDNIKIQENNEKEIEEYDISIKSNPQYIVDYIYDIIQHMKQTEVYLINLANKFPNKGLYERT